MRLRSLPLPLALAALVGCREPAPTPPPAATPALPEVRVLGFRARLPWPGAAAPLPAFDADSMPVLRFESPPPTGLRVRRAGAPEPLPVETERREAVTLVRVTALGMATPVATETADHLLLEVPTADGAYAAAADFPIVLAPPPDARPELAELRATVKGLPPAEAATRLETALPTEPPASRLWLSVDVARKRAQLGGPDATAAWEASAEVARAQGVTSEVGRRLRAAAAQEVRRRSFDGATRLLDAAEAAEGRDGERVDPAGHIRLETQRAYRDKALGDFRLATERLRAAVRDAWLSGLDVDWASTAQALAVLLQDQGSHHKALELMERVSGFYEKHPHEADGGPVFANNYAWILLRAMADEAIRFDPARLRALFETVQADSRASGRAQAEAITFSNLAELALESDDLAAADHVYADWSAREAEMPGFSHFDHGLLGAELLRRRGHAKEALAALDHIAEAAAAESHGLVADVVVQARHAAARALVDLGRTREARARYDGVLDDLRALALRTDLQGERSPFLARRHAIFDEAISLALSAGDLAAAFDRVDQGASPALQSLRTELDREHLPPAERAALQKRIGAWLQARDEVEALASKRRLASDEERAHIDAELATRRETLAHDFDALGTALGTRATRRASEVAGALGPGEALISFFRLGAQDHALRLSGGHFEHLGPLPPTALLEQLHAATAPDAVTYIVPGDLPAARDLAETWPDRAVALLPFASILLDSPAQPPAAAVPKPADVLLVADPNDNLRHAREEGRELSDWLGAAPGRRLLTGEQADRPAVLAALQSRPPTLFHFSGHGILTGESAWDAHLRLTADARFTVADVLAVRAPMARVVLDGCETGSGVALSLREQIGLADAFLLAGARTVVATAREVDDAQARRVFLRFYAAGGAADPLTALHTLRTPAPGEAPLDRETVGALRLFGRAR